VKPGRCNSRVPQNLHNIGAGPAKTFMQFPWAGRYWTLAKRACRKGASGPI